MAELAKMKDLKALSRKARKEQAAGRREMLDSRIADVEARQRERLKRLAGIGIRKVSGPKKWKRKRYREEHDSIDRMHGEVARILRRIQRTVSAYAADGGSPLQEIRAIDGEVKALADSIKDAGKSRKRWAGIAGRLSEICSQTKQLFWNTEFIINPGVIGRVHGSDIHHWDNNAERCREMHRKLTRKP